MESSSSSEGDSIMSPSVQGTSAPSSPPTERSPQKLDFEQNQVFAAEEENARLENEKADKKRREALLRKRRKKKAETKAEREAKARELDELLQKSAAFSDILTKKTQALGRVGSSLDGETLGEHNLQMAQQPKCMIGGTMRDYQLEGLTWMFEICQQGMSGILADEMGLGKTVQTIALIALLREQENYLGPHLIVAPLSTLSNWMDEFEKWTPSIPVIMYHGTKKDRDEIFRTKILSNLNKKGRLQRPNERFPVVCTSYEMVLRDQANLSRISWEFIIIDEGHRMKNAEAKLFQQLRQFSSATRLLITGTPLQNNLKELWSLLHFLLPTIFTDWEAFESWFDFSDLEDEVGTEEFIGDKMKKDLVKKIHLILQPLLLRRIKQDVEAYLPKKREYVLFAPMTREQTDLYNVLSDKNCNARQYLEEKAIEKFTSATASLRSSRGSSRSGSTAPLSKTAHATDKATSLPLRQGSRQKKGEERTTPETLNVFNMMMGKRQAQPSKAESVDRVETPSQKGSKRKGPPSSIASGAKSAKSSRHSTPVSSRSRPRTRRVYTEADVSDEEQMSDDEFEEKLAGEIIKNADETTESEESMSVEEIERAETLELAKKQIAQKKLGNPLAQLRLVCNSPHNFYNPWMVSDELPIDESIVTASGKMLLLDRLLPKLFKHGHKVLLFSQFRTQLDILEDYCHGLRGWSVCRIDGGVDQASRREQIRSFNSDPDQQIFLLSTRAGGQGINLASADTVILFDSDFNPQQDLQAQDRCHRIGQTRPVIVYRLATKDTVEETLLLSADAKRRLEKLVIRKGGFKTMGQKIDSRAEAEDEDLDRETLRALLLKDGLVYDTTGGDRVLSDRDLKVLTDRSEEAYEMAAKGQGDADGYRVVETGADSIKMARKE